MSIRPQELSPDPIITNFAVMAGQGGPFVMDLIAPVVPIDQAYKWPTYPRAELKAPPEDAVGILGKPNKYRFVAPTWVNGQTTRHALDDEMSTELTLAPGNSFLQQQGARTAMLVHSLKMNIEKRGKALLDGGTYSANAVVKWNAASGTIDPENDIDIAKTAIEGRGGLATHIIIPPAVARAMKRAPKIRELRKDTDSSLLINGDLPPKLFNLNVIIPGALADSAAAGLAANVGFLWDTDTVYVLMIDPSISGNQEAFTALAQMRWASWGTPFQGYSWPDPHQSKRSTWTSVDVHQNEHLVADGAVYRITDCLV